MTDKELRIWGGVIWLAGGVSVIIIDYKYWPLSIAFILAALGWWKKDRFT